MRMLVRLKLWSVVVLDYLSVEFLIMKVPDAPATIANSSCWTVDVCHCLYHKWPRFAARIHNRPDFEPSSVSSCMACLQCCINTNINTNNLLMPLRR